MRSERDEHIMLLRGNYLYPSSKTRDKPLQFFTTRGKNIRSTAKQRCLCLPSPASLLTRHWMPTDKSPPPNFFNRPSADGALRAPSIGDQRPRLNKRINLIEHRKNPLNRPRQVNQIGHRCGLGERQGLVNDAPLDSHPNGINRAYANNLASESRSP